MYHRQATAHLPVFLYCFNIKIRHGWDKAPCKDLNCYLLSSEGFSVISKPQKCVYPHHVFNYKYALWHREAEAETLSYKWHYSGDIVLHISCFECVLFSSYITFHNERLSNELEFKSHMLLLRENNKKTNFTTRTNYYYYLFTVISGVKIVFKFTTR